MFKLVSRIIKKPRGCFKFKTEEARMKCASSTISVSEKLYVAAYLSPMAIFIKEGLTEASATGAFLTILFFTFVGLSLHFSGLACIDKIEKNKRKYTTKENP